MHYHMTRDSLKRKFLMACKKCVCVSIDQSSNGNDALSKVKKCVNFFQVDVNCKVEEKFYLLDAVTCRRNEVSSVYSGYSGLHFAMTNGDSSFYLLEFLLFQPNVDVNIKEDWGRTPVMRLIVDTKRRDDHDESWRPSETSKNFYLSTLRRLLAVDTLILDTEDKSISFAHAVVGSWHALEFIEVLKDDPRMNWNVKDKEGKTPIQVAMDMEMDDVVRAFVMIEAVDKSMIPAVLLRNVKENYNNRKRKRDEIRDGLPECPVCINVFQKDQKNFQCVRGHFVCGDCRPRLQHCPECRGKIIGRAYGFEKFISNL